MLNFPEKRCLRTGHNQNVSWGQRYFRKTTCKSIDLVSNLSNNLSRILSVIPAALALVALLGTCMTDVDGPGSEKIHHMVFGLATGLSLHAYVFLQCFVIKYEFFDKITIFRALIKLLLILACMAQGTSGLTRCQISRVGNK